MLPAHARLRRPAEFTAVVRGGRRAARGGVVVHLLPAGEAFEAGSVPAGPRVGLIVTRAVGNAVRRHRVSRRLRHLIRARLDRLAPGEMVVLRARPEAADRDSAELAADLDAALARLRSVEVRR